MAGAMAAFEKMAGSRKGVPEQRRSRILDAALNLVLKNGLRGTSMEALAAEAQIAKPTLYGYFANKEAVFAAVAERLFDELRAVVEKGLRGKGDLAFRISLALTAKHKRVFCLLEGSPHGEEIYSEKSRIAAEQVQDFEKWLQERIAMALKEGGRDLPQNHAMVLIACAQGIAQKAERAGEIGPAIRLVVEKLLA